MKTSTVGQVSDLARQRTDRSLQRPDGLDVAQDQDGPGVELGQVETQPEGRLDRRAKVQGLGGAPIEIARRYGDREQAQRDGDAARAAAIQQEGDDDGRQPEDRLGPQVEREASRRRAMTTSAAKHNRPNVAL
jgi:hypothetical protein